ncbi:hypothetical protein NHX12_022374 [Muraenolepis orangiensis]|uniref:Uncharacterized protein n=1 Tax=Muraenolepis orangiensis TaxID=630683 RepID=A0A9Q0ENH6_9TELE|nr:hypothetical protein NHX12_022374 [Muraenolepis orangiensis]
MSKAVVVFVKSEQIVHQQVASGVFIRDLYVQVSPLSVPSTRITVSGVPPFIPKELLENELRRFGKFASVFKTPAILDRPLWLHHKRLVLIWPLVASFLRLTCFLTSAQWRSKTMATPGEDRLFKRRTGQSD